MTPLMLALQGPAELDLEHHANWLRGEAEVDVAERFLIGAQDSFTKLAASSGLGSIVDTRSPELAGARRWRI